MAHKALEGLDAESELTHRERSLQSEAARPKAVEIFWKCVFRPINDPKVFPAPAFHGGPDDSFRGVGHKLHRLDHHALPPPTPPLFPPLHPPPLPGPVPSLH